MKPTAEKRIAPTPWWVPLIDEVIIEARIDHINLPMPHYEATERGGHRCGHQHRTHEAVEKCQRRIMRAEARAALQKAGR